MVVHGGYDGQNTFADTYILSTCDWTWRQVVSTGKGSSHTHSYMQHATLCPSSEPNLKADLSFMQSCCMLYCSTAEGGRSLLLKIQSLCGLQASTQYGARAHGLICTI